MEDDGAIYQGGTFTSQAVTLTPATKLTIDLTTYDNHVDAQRGYSELIPPQDSSPAPQTLAGVGDKAIRSATGVLVLKKAQVLTVRMEPSQASNDKLDQAKSAASSFDAVQSEVNDAMLHDTQTVAEVIAQKMTGQGISRPVSYLPHGAIDPCVVKATSLNSRDIHVTSQPVMSESAPALECVYTFAGSRTGEAGTGQLVTFTLSGAQAATAVPASTVQTFYGNAVAGSSSGGRAGYSSNGSGAFQASGTTQGEPDYLVVFNGPTSAVTKGVILLRIEDYHSSFLLVSQDCASLIEKMFIQMLESSTERNASAYYSRNAFRERFGVIINNLDGWCKMDAAAHR